MGVFNFFNKFYSKQRFNNILEVYLQDNRCGNKIKVILRKSYDIQRIYEEKEADFEVNKVVICDKCFNKIKINIQYDKKYNVISRKIEGGSFINKEDFYK